MKSKGNVLLLSEEGLLHVDKEPYSNIPFQQTSVIAGDVHENQVAVIVDKHDVWTFVSGEWQQVVSTDITLNCICWTSDTQLLVGTESARLAWIANGSLTFIDSFDKIPERQHWMTPWGGPPDVRSLAVSQDGTLYADIHVGWIARSRDGGQTWENLRNGLEIDVHQVTTHPLEPATVFAATADGFYISKDHGDTFTRHNSGLSHLYSRACVCFLNHETYLLSTSKGPHSHVEAQLYRSDDEGTDWNVVNGLPKTISNNIDTFQIIIAAAGHAFVIIENTSLYETNDYGVNWKNVRDDYPRLFGALILAENCKIT